MGPEMQVQPPEARVLPARRPLTWILIAVALLTAGVLSFVAGLIHWWDPCVTDGFDSAGCITRQSDPSDLTDFTVLPTDQRQAAIMLASSNLLIGLLWFSLVFVGARNLAGRVMTVISGVYLVVAAHPHLWWYAHGQVQVLLGNQQTMSALFWRAMILMMMAAVLMWRPGEPRLVLLIIGLLAGSPLGFWVDYFFWSMIYASHDTPPGAGWAQAVVYIVAGGGILYLTLTRYIRAGAVGRT